MFSNDITLREKLHRLLHGALLVLIFTVVSTSSVAGQHADHDDHDHDAHTEVAAVEDHSDDDHGDHEEGIVELTPEAMKMAGIRLAHAEYGSIGTSIHVPGEVGFDQDRLVHVVPRFAGIAAKSFHRIGDRVESGATLAVIESNESLSAYTIKAPIAGWVIEKHITPGEYVSDENPIYVIADLSHVWVDLAVYPKDADKVTPGQTVTLQAIGTDTRADGVIEYITPILDSRTRSLTARIILPNPDNLWRPGTFVHADIAAGTEDKKLLVAKDAVQILDGESVVFVPADDDGFSPLPVTVGRTDSNVVEILDGLTAGAEYVAAGAFELKAKIVTSSLDAHAGHGH